MFEEKTWKSYVKESEKSSFTCEIFFRTNLFTAKWFVELLEAAIGGVVYKRCS